MTHTHKKHTVNKANTWNPIFKKNLNLNQNGASSHCCGSLRNFKNAYPISALRACDLMRSTSLFQWSPKTYTLCTSNTFPPALPWPVAWPVLDGRRWSWQWRKWSHRSPRPGCSSRCSCYCYRSFAGPPAAPGTIPGSRQCKTQRYYQVMKNFFK